MQPLAALAHQGLPAGGAQAAVALEASSQLGQGALIIRAPGQAVRRLAAAAGEKGAEALLTALQVAETALRLHPQGLLQGGQPIARWRARGQG